VTRIEAEIRAVLRTIIAQEQGLSCFTAGFGKRKKTDLEVRCEKIIEEFDKPRKSSQRTVCRACHKLPAQLCGPCTDEYSRASDEG